MHGIKSVQRRQLYRFLNQYKLVIIAAIGLAFALGEPAFAQCIGWLCGPKDVLRGNAVLSNDASAIAMIDFFFLVVQVIALAVLAALAVPLVHKLRREEDYMAPFVAVLAALMLIIGINYLGGYLMGNGASPGAANTTTTGGVTNVRN
ncbi:MAG: hypothetical protein HC851_20275 [Acaryochloris sp. RU_4_1]|nr:hypothetical protein [Acaryochloris sp. RU_4_1]NJR56195.1 hypothetical protein [Acaryochloris sp. CRU_2_0]